MAERTRPPQDSTTGSGLEHAGLATGIVGVVLVGTSIYLASRASSDATAVSNFHGEWTSAQESIQSSGQSAATWGTVCGVVGAAAIVGGATMYLLGWHQASEHEVSVAITPSGAEVGWAIAF